MSNVFNRRNTIVVLVLALVMVLAWLVTTYTASAQSTTPTPDQVNAVAKELWCPLCNGVRLDNCELQACVQMREEISLKLGAGQDKDQIKAYFVQRYGDVVLGMPPNQGFNRLAWIVPVALVVLGLGWVTYLVLVWARRRPASPQVRASGHGSPRSTESGDDYLKRVDDELKKHD